MKSAFTRGGLGGLALYCLVVATAEAGSVVVFNSFGEFAVPVQSFKEARFRSTVRQQYDFSCGSAALATLLTHHYQNPTTEQTAFEVMYRQGDRKKIRKEGFSLLDIKRYLDAQGYQADGFLAPLDDLVTLGIPAIALIQDAGYKHFVVITGVSDEKVLVSDPSLGGRILSREEFKSKWNGILFFIRNKVDIASNYFNRPGDWRLRARAPLSEALSRESLANSTLFLPPRSDF